MCVLHTSCIWNKISLEISNVLENHLKRMTKLWNVSHYINCIFILKTFFSKFNIKSVELDVPFET